MKVIGNMILSRPCWVMQGESEKDMQKLYCEYCGRLLSEGCECHIIAAQDYEEFLTNYECDPMINYGWGQQDMIDMYRRER